MNPFGLCVLVYVSLPLLWLIACGVAAAVAEVRYRWRRAPAEFIGWQADADGGHFELFNLTRAIPGHPFGSTVSRQTLEEAGFDVPPSTPAAVRFFSKEIHEHK